MDSRHVSDLRDRIQRSDLARVAAILQAYGDRVQRGVFVCAIEPGVLAEARERISQIINPETDSVYVFRYCGMLGSGRDLQPGGRGSLHH